MKIASQPDPVADADWPKPVAPSLEVSTRIRQECTGDLCKERGLSARARWLSSLAVSVGVVALLAFLSRDHARISGSFRDALIGASGWGVVQALVLWAGLVQPPGRRFPRAVRLALAAALPLMFLGYLAYLAPAWVSFGEFSQGAHARHAIICGLFVFLFGAALSGAIMLLWRRTDPLTPGLSGALLGLVGGVGGGLAWGLMCPSQEGFHACFSHGLGVLALVSLGWAVGRRLLAPS